MVSVERVQFSVFVVFPCFAACRIEVLLSNRSFSEGFNSLGTGLSGTQVDGAAWGFLFTKTGKGLFPCGFSGTED
jgi:hypothetical protein